MPEVVQSKSMSQEIKLNRQIETKKIIGACQILKQADSRKSSAPDLFRS